MVSILDCLGSAHFDGIRFKLYDGRGNEVASALAVSGLKLAQNPTLQSMRNVGPIPEGKYTFSTRRESRWRLGENELQVRDDEVWGDQWGSFRAHLSPADGTNTYGRDEFWLHGSRNENDY